MKIDVKTVKEIAELSRLNITDESAAQEAKQLEIILGYMAELNEINTNGVEPLYQVFPLENVWREDQVSESLTKEQVFANAPEEDGSYFQVPGIREGE